jgi:hypothetical protein
MKTIKYLLLLTFLLNINTVYSQKWWAYASLCDGGLGASSFISSKNSGNGFGGHLNIAQLGVGFDKLGGLGFGTALADWYFLKDYQAVSFVPVYLYMPLLISKPKAETDLRNRRPWFVTLYSGGTLWGKNDGDENTEYFKKYINAGVICIRTWSFGDDIYSMGNFSIRAGMLAGKTFTGKTEKVLYVTLGIGLGSYVIK